MQQRILVVLLGAIVAIMLLIIGVIFLTSRDNDLPQQQAQTTILPTAEEDGSRGLVTAAVPPERIRQIDYEPILDANYWMDEFPYQTESFLKDRETSPRKNYLELYPFLNIIFAGSRFEHGYYSPQPHIYAVESAKASSRVTDEHTAACFACKTPDYVIMEARNPQGTWSRGFHEVADDMKNTITCYDCHRNEPGRGLGGEGLDGGFTGSIRSHFSIWYEETRGSTASCAQCHNEYYFDQTTGQVNLPPGPTDPDIIFAYYNALGLVDHVNPNTGTEHIKVQHPEYQHFAGSVHQEEGMTCVDCHMGRSTSDGQGGFLTNHKILSPSQSDEVLESCGRCHAGGNDAVRNLIRSTQDSTITRRNALGERLATFMIDFASAQEAERLSEQRVGVLRGKEREAVFFFDWVFSENGNGVHNYIGAMAWLDRVEQTLDRAESLLRE